MGNLFYGDVVQEMIGLFRHNTYKVTIKLQRILAILHLNKNICKKSP